MREAIYRNNLLFGDVDPPSKSEDVDVSKSVSMKNCLEEQKVKIIYSKFCEIFQSYARNTLVLLSTAFYCTKPRVGRYSVG